jgi:uncharacterized protein involved in type VI secretion and phage assembly
MTDSGTVQSSFSVTTPFTQNQISILSFHGEEALSNLFFLEVQLRADSDSLAWHCDAVFPARQK